MEKTTDFMVPIIKKMMEKKLKPAGFELLVDGCVFAFTREDITIEVPVDTNYPWTIVDCECENRKVTGDLASRWKETYNYLVEHKYINVDE